MPLAATDFVSPAELIGVTTAFLGGRIDLDPASSHAANTLINAQRYFTPDDNGLKQTWKAKNVYLYPPKDFLNFNEQPADPNIFRKRRRFAKSAQRVWLEECYRQYLRNNFKEAIVFLTSSEVALISTQRLKIDFPMCILKEHPALHLDRDDLPKLQNSRCYGFVFYFPDSENPEKRVNEFIDLYSPLGRVYY
jgi:hypothetical protein